MAPGEPAGYGAPMHECRTPVSWAVLAIALVGGCAAAPAASEPADEFLANLSAMQGQAFAGRVVENTPARADDPFEGASLIMHVREASEHAVRIPLHVGDDRSRTWICRRTATGLRLEHDHRHADGTPDAITMYGGDTTAAGTATRQEFPINAETHALFTRADLAVSLTNVWAMEIEPGQRFAYELSRPDGRLFRLEFDLTAPVPAPPAPWGHATR